MADHFYDLKESVVFEHLVTLLDTSFWAKDKSVHTKKALSEIVAHFKPLLEKNNCVVEDVLVELSALRSYILPIIENNKSDHYLDLWGKKTFFVLIGVTRKRSTQRLKDIGNLLRKNPESIGVS